MNWCHKEPRHKLPPYYSNSQTRNLENLQIHDDIINSKHFPRYWLFVRGNPPVTGVFPSQRPVTRSFDVFFDLCLNKRFRKQSWGWWFQTPSCSLWRHCNVDPRNDQQKQMSFQKVLLLFYFHQYTGVQPRDGKVPSRKRGRGLYMTHTSCSVLSYFSRNNSSPNNVEEVIM